MIKHLPKNSLHILKKDPRDFKLGAVFKQIKLESVPNTDFRTNDTFYVKDQGEDDLCSAYAVTAVSEDQEGEELLPEYQFLKTKLLSGDIEEWGADLRDACKSAVKFGSLPVRGFIQFRKIARNLIFIIENWPSSADEVAKIHKKSTFFSVLDGKYDTFDNIRCALWQHRDNKNSIVTGILWRPEWIDAPNGVIPKENRDVGFGHAMKIFGQKNIDGELYLEAQLSQGAYVGNGGLFYFPREVVNKEIGKYGAFMFNDISREEAEFYMQNKMPLENNFIKLVWSFIKKIFSK
jgi:hypothetical protein